MLEEQIPSPQAGESQPAGVDEAVSRGMAGLPLQPELGPYDDNKALLDFYTTFRDECLEDRTVYEREWWRKLMYILGRQWIYFDRKRGQWQDKRLTKWTPKPVTNIVAETVDVIRSVFASVQLALVARPNGQDPRNVAAAEMADELEPLIAIEHDMKRATRESDFWLASVHNVFWHVWWDKNAETNGTFVIPHETCQMCQQTFPPSALVDAGNVCPTCGGMVFSKAVDAEGNPDGQKMKVGKGATDVVSPFEMLVPPSYTRFGDVPGVIRQRWRTARWWREHYPELSKTLVFSQMPSERSLQLVRSLSTQTDVSGSPTAWSAGGDSGAGSEGLAEYELWYKPCPKYADGLFLRVAGDSDPKIVRDPKEGTPGPLPYEDNDGRKLFPWLFMQFQQFGGRLWGKGPIDLILQKQDQINQIDSLIQMIIQRVANPIWLKPKGANVTSFTGEPGLVVEWDSLGASGAKPERIPGENVPPSLMQIRQQLLNDVERLSGCLDGDTRIPCLDGNTRTMREMATEFPNGGMWVYGFDPSTMRVVPSYVEGAWRVGVKPAVRVTFKEGTYLDCTADHPVLTYTRGYVQASELEVDEPVVPLVLKSATFDGRVSVHQPVDRETIPVHRMVAQVLHNLPRRNAKHLDVHHIDKNPLNNLPENLEVLTRKEHIAKEPRPPFPRQTSERLSSFSAKRWEGTTADERRVSVRPMVDALKQYWAGLSVEARTERNHKNWQKLTPSERKVQLYSAMAHRKSLSVAARISLAEKQSAAMREYAAEQEVAQAARSNHRVASVEPIGDKEVYDLTTTTVNFGTESGVFVHNTYDIMRGNKPAGVEAFSALQLLVERSQSRFALVLQERGDAYKQWYALALELERQFGPQERTWAMLGPNRRWTFRHFQNANLQGAIEIVVEDGSQVPKTNLGKRAAIEQANQLRMVDPKDPDQRYAIFRDFGITHLLPGLDVHVKAALQEQDELERWVEESADADPMQRAPFPMVVKKWHDDPIHISEHRKWANGDRVRKILLGDPALEAGLNAHFDEHEMAAMMKELPPAQRAQMAAGIPIGPAQAAGQAKKQPNPQGGALALSGSNRESGATGAPPPGSQVPEGAPPQQAL